jgi:hypothetical protein
VDAKGPKPHPEMAPASMQAIYEYGSRGNLPPVKLTWYQGLEKPQIWKEKGIPQWGSGHLFIGDKGMLLSDYKQHLLLPEEKFAGFKGPDPFIPRSPAGHHKDWVAACKGGPATLCDFEYSGLLTEANHLGNVAYRAGKKLHWDSENMRATNAPEAEPFIRREYRKGWTLS